MRKFLTALIITSAGLSASAASAAEIYLNKDNITVEVGSNTSEGSFNNTFSGGNTIDKVIDAPSADASEDHTQDSHIWFTADENGGGLELLFDFQQEYDLTTLHFWNYFTEVYDVDQIDFTFFNESNAQVGSLTVLPNLGTSPGITAQDYLLAAPLNVRFVSAFLTGSNRQVDFQNIGFTGQLSIPVSDVPLPGALVMMLTGLAGFGAFKRKKA